MLKNIKKLTKQTAVYGIGGVLNKLLGVILLPVYTKFIPIDSFGILAMLELLILFLSQFLTFGIPSGHLRYFFIEKEKNTYGRFLFTNLSTLVFILFSILLVLNYNIPFVSDILFSKQIDSILIQLTLLLIGLEILQIYPSQILQFEEKSIKYTALNLLRFLSSFGFVLYFVIFEQMNIKGILLGRVIGVSFTFVISFLLVVIPKIKFEYDFSAIKKTIKYGFPLIFSGFAHLIFTMSDRYMLQNICSETEVGYYSFGYKVANFISIIFVHSLAISYIPAMLKQEKQDNNKRFYTKITTYYSVFISFIVLSFLFFYKPLLNLVVFNKEYWIGIAVIPVLICSFAISGLNWFTHVGIAITKKTYLLIISSSIVAIVNIGINFYLIPKYGFLGAGIATLISQTINASLVIYFSKKVYNIKFEINKILLVVLISTIIYLVGQINFYNDIIKIVVRVLLLVSFPFILFKLNFFEKIEIERIKQSINKWKNIKNIKSNILKEL